MKYDERMKTKYNDITLKAINISIADEMKTIDRLRRVITKPARRQELDSLYNKCLETFITINTGA